MDIFGNSASFNRNLTSKNDEKILTNLNDQELNTLPYEKALIYDRRTYCQYYKSLLNKKHLILFAFLPANDYNLKSIKISLLILSFSLYFTMNGLFFNDSSMHKIFVEKGSYNLIYQIPKLLYSTVVSSLINMILRLLSLTEQNILKIKNDKNIKSDKKAKFIKNCIMIKFMVFYLLSIIFLLFFWYFISCFCGVYSNTQKILIKDIFISFGMSMIYPFGLNLIPGLFRFPALKGKKHDKKFIYQLSGLLSLFL